MNTENEKISVFLENINSDADAQCKRIRQEADRYVMQELNKARQRAHEDVKSFTKTEIDRLNEETNAGFSELEAQEKKKLIDRRSKITNEVFNKAKSKLIDFTKSDKYFDFLAKSINSIKTAIGEDSVIIVKPDDKKYEAELLKLCKEIKYDPSIKIGGCKAENIANKLIADDTIDSRLEEKKSDFYKNSGLSITM